MPKLVDHEARRADILAGCLPLFASRGYASLTMRGIAKELGVSTGSLYHYFDSKRSIFEAMIESMAGRALDAAAEGLPADAPPDAHLRAILQALPVLLDDLQRDLLLALDFRRHADGPEDRALAARLLGMYRGALRDRLGLSAAGASLLLSLVLGLLAQRQLDPGSIELGPHLELFTELARR